MTTEPNESENDPVDRLSNHWLDAEPDDSEFGESAIDTSESLDSEQLCRVADVQLLHAMLTGLAENSQDARQRRVNKLMQSIRADKEKIAGEKATSTQKPRRKLSSQMRQFLL